MKIGSIVEIHTIKADFRDLGLRFVFGGTAVAVCYILLQLIPSKSFAGIFAAFPAVMAASVIMAGYFGSSSKLLTLPSEPVQECLAALFVCSLLFFAWSTLTGGVFHLLLPFLSGSSAHMQQPD